MLQPHGGQKPLTAALSAPLLFAALTGAARIVSGSRLEELAKNSHLEAAGDSKPMVASSASVGGIFDFHEAENAECAAAVHRSVMASEGGCRCEPGSFVVGDAGVCQTQTRVDHFSLQQFANHGFLPACVCEEEDHTMCGNQVRGAVLEEPARRVGAEQCKCPSGSFLMGDGARCNPAERTRRFDPAAFEGCQCSWDFGALPDWREHLETFWGDIMHTNNPQGIEPKCRPFIEGSGARGVVLLMHGATACSGWWYLVKDQLIADGWMVVATTHVGHGRKPTIDPGAEWGIVDYLEDMPTHGRGYIDYSNELNRAMKKYKTANPGKQMVIMGHSIGGAMSTNMVIEEPNLWDKFLLMNPFFAPALLPTFLDRALTRSITSLVMPTLDWQSDAERYRWSEGCDEIRKQGQGHGGMCQFSILHLRGWFQLGDIVQKKDESIGAERGVYQGIITEGWNIARGYINRLWGGGGSSSSPVQGQIMVTINDGAVQNANVQFLSRAFDGWARGGDDFCALPTEFTHNWVCPIDFPWMDHWWLDRSRVEGGITAIDRMAAFARDGTPVPVSGVVAAGMNDDEIIGAPMCAVHRAR